MPAEAASGASADAVAMPAAVWDGALPEPITRVGTQRDVLGECPLWCERGQCLWWVDIRTPLLRRWVPATQVLTSWAMPDMIGAIALADDGRVLVALSSRLALFDPHSGANSDAERLTLPTTAETVIVPHASAFETLIEPNFSNLDHRFNDGRCDAQGRLWIGSMNNLSRGPEGRLFRFERSTGLVEVLAGICIPNSLAFSPDGGTLYFADSLRHRIEAFDFDAASGSIGPAWPFATSPAPAFPDGSCVDEHGYLWNAEFHGARLLRYAPDGRLDRVIALPVRRPTCCTFGGADLATLYITTTCQKMRPADLAAEPLAGALLALRPGVRGLPEPRFKT